MPARNYGDQRMSNDVGLTDHDALDFVFDPRSQVAKRIDGNLTRSGSSLCHLNSIILVHLNYNIDPFAKRLAARFAQFPSASVYARLCWGGKRHADIHLGFLGRRWNGHE